MGRPETRDTKSVEPASSGSRILDAIEEVVGEDDDDAVDNAGVGCEAVQKSLVEQGGMVVNGQFGHNNRGETPYKCCNDTTY